MATTNKKTPTKADIEKELKDTKSALDEALALSKELKANPATPQVVVQQNNPKISKIKCINLAHNPVNVATQPNAQGRVFTFKEYGQAQGVQQGLDTVAW